MEVRFKSDLKEGLLFVFLSCPLLGQSFPSLAPLPEWNLKAAYFTRSKFQLYAPSWIISSLAHNQLFPCAAPLFSPLHFYALEKLLSGLQFLPVESGTDVFPSSLKEMAHSWHSPVGIELMRHVHSHWKSWVCCRMVTWTEGLKWRRGCRWWWQWCWNSWQWWQW